jgi:hypothetical protein
LHATIPDPTVETVSARTVVICGSMKSLALMSRIAQFLRSSGLDAVVPTPDEPSADCSAERFNLMKREAAWRHMSHIRQEQTAAVLVVNVDRPNVPDYIGPNSFAEIGVAFAACRRVFLLQNMPDSYTEELTAWGVTCLDRDVRPLLDAMSAPSDIDRSAWQAALQGEYTFSMD